VLELAKVEGGIEKVEGGREALKNICFQCLSSFKGGGGNTSRAVIVPGTTIGSGRKPPTHPLPPRNSTIELARMGELTTQCNTEWIS